MTKAIKAWHFVSDTLRDGRPVPPDGAWLRHDGELILRDSGLHASRRLLDALRHAPGATICRVELRGEMLHGGDKLVASERRILWRIDGERLLRDFARRCALDVVHLWNCPDIVLQYLRTGREDLQDAARDAARDAAWAARDAARDAAWAAWGAAWGATRDATLDATLDAALDATLDATLDAALDATLDATLDAACKKQSHRLTSMVIAEHRGRK